MTVIIRFKLISSEKNADNLLMWAHYDNGLRGFCLEFDKDFILTDEVNANIFEVLYENKPSTIDTAVSAVLIDQADYHEDAIYDTEIGLNMQR